MENIEEQESARSQVKIGDVVFATFQHWPWIVLSVVICVGLALLYVMRSQPSYSRSSQVVITDDTSGNSMSSQLDAFADMGLVTTNTNILDEINKLKSPDVMREVINRLDLTMNYSIPGKLHKNVVYGATLPLKVSLPSLLEGESAKLKVEVDKNGNVTLSDLRRDDEKIEYSGRPFKLGESVNTPIGTVKVEKTVYYKPGEDYTLFVTKNPMIATIEAYSKKLKIDLPDQKASTVELSITDKTIQRAEDILNTVIDVYNENWIDSKNLITAATNKFINERLVTIEKELGNVDNDISSYQSEHMVPDVKQAAELYMSEDQRANDQILEINNQLQMARFMRQYLSDASHRNEVLPANSGIGNQAIEKLISDYNERVLRRNRLADNSSSTHPVVMDMDAEIADMRNAIISSIDNDIVNLNTQMRNVQGVKGRAQAEIASSPVKANYLLSVERQQKVKESLYLFLLQKREENELSKAFIAYNTHVITKPYGLNDPVKPRKAIILAMSFILGFMIPFGVTFVREVMNTKVRGKKDIEELTMPLIGEIPYWKMSKKDRQTHEANGISERVVVEEGNRDIINDAFRVLRTNIGFMSRKSGEDGEGRATAIMLTSVNPGSGKSYISINLAVSLALRNKKVALIDADLRHGSTSEVVGSPSKGISDYLAGHSDDWSKVVVRDEVHKNVDIYPVGQYPPNPTELLESERFKKLIETIRNEYDYILIDCPPIGVMADAQIVEKLCDRCIFVLRVGLLERSMIPEIERLCQEKKFKNMSIILNGTVNGGKNGYGYGYHNGSYYGGYGNDKNK